MSHGSKSKVTIVQHDPKANNIGRWGHINVKVLYLNMYLIPKLYCFQGKKREGSNTAVFYVSLLAGLVAGGTASFCVNPFDGMYYHLHVLCKVYEMFLIVFMLYNLPPNVKV